MNAPTLIRESREARLRVALTKAQDALRDSLRDVSDLAQRLQYGDFALPTGRTLDRAMLVAEARQFEARLFAWREACAAVAGASDDIDTSDGEGLENALIDAFEAHFTVALAS